MEFVLQLDEQTMTFGVEVFSLPVPPILHLKLPNKYICMKLLSSEYISDVDFAQCIPINIFQKNGVWIDIRFSNLNLDPGFHSYRINGILDDEYVIFNLQYRIQSSYPDRPYIYMKSEKSRRIGNG